MGKPTRNRMVDRREFIKQGAMAGLGAGLLSFAGKAAAVATPGVSRYAPLGRTGMRISDISFGSGRLQSGQEDLVVKALDLGINYFDTANDYTDGEAETTIGRALAGKRNKVFIASKATAGASDSKESIMAELEGSLRRLQTDHVDVYFNHAVNDVARLKNPEWYEFAAQAKKQGKIRFAGVSGHAGRLSDCLDYAIDSGHFDVILAAYNFGQDPAFYQRFLRRFDMVSVQPEMPRLIRKAKAKGMGFIAMKTLMGARLNDMRPYESGGATFAQAAFRWVLSNRDVDGLIVTMKDGPVIDEYLGASGSHASAKADIPLLHRYMRINGSSQCRQGCGICESSCPAGVPIGEVLRTRMYAKDYGDLRMAQSEYARLGAAASLCIGCSHHACAGACPHGVKTEEMLAPTHTLLSQS
jgi:predicted aldo/keto reductase-like oxidoreductase